MRPLIQNFIRVGLLLLLLISAVVRSFAADPEARFQEANTAYARGDYGEAAFIYRELADSHFAPGALHNLGNVEWKVLRPGYAILAWERALSLSPNNRNTIANLRFARLASQLEEPQRPWFEQYSVVLPAWAWIVIATVGLWGGLAFLTLPRLLGRSRIAWTQAVAALALALFLLSSPALVGLWQRQQIGVVLSDDAALLLTPTRLGEVLVKPAAGELARVEKERGEYFYVRASQDRAGWISKREFARIWER
jgi:hypothetical protein